MRKKIYVAGPYSKGDTVLNVREAILAGDRLWALGYAPLIPHLTHFWHLLCPHDYETWLAYDNELLPCCDAVLRLPGGSSGTDKEVALARSLGLPVYESVGVLLSSMPRRF
jgi:uncharacterized protein DUF4406